MFLIKCFKFQSSALINSEASDIALEDIYIMVTYFLANDQKMIKSSAPLVYF